MKTRLGILLAAGIATMSAQQITGTMRADIRGGGGEGKCTIEVWVDDTAEVEVRGRVAVIRTFAGSPASFRRFQCNQEMPRNPSGFRFKGIDGRGHQSLVREPYSSGPAVVRINDSKGGGEGYTFDLIWSGTGGYGGGYGNSSRNSGGGYGSSGWNSGGGYGGGGFGTGGGWHSSGGSEGGGWNDGWGQGNGWIENGNFKYEGGRRGSGEYRDRNGRTRRLDTARMFISDSGVMAVEFQSERGLMEFGGRVTRREGRRVFCDVKGVREAAGASGTLEIEMASPTQVRHIYMREIDLRWSN